MEQQLFDPDGVGVANGAYFGLPFAPDDAELVLVSVPWDVTVSYGAGTVYAPDAIIEASTQLDFYDPMAPGAWRRGIATADIDYSLQELSQRLRADAARVIEYLENGGSPHDESIVRKLTLSDYEESIFNKRIDGQALDKLHIFMHNEMLMPVDGESKRKVRLYIKLGEIATTDPNDNRKVIVVSFHEAEY